MLLGICFIFVVEGLCQFIELAALHTDAVLHAFVLRLEIAESRGGLQVGVTFHGDHQPAKRPAELLLSGLELGHFFRGEIIGVQLDASGLGACFDHVGERGFCSKSADPLMISHDVLRLISTELIGVFHVAPLCGHAFVHAYHAPLEADGPEGDNGNDAKYDEQGTVHGKVVLCFLPGWFRECKDAR
jgi:hypothetical protein